MKVYIGPSRNGFGPWTLANAIFFWVDPFTWDEDKEDRWDFRLHSKVGNYFSKNKLIVKFCKFIDKYIKQRIKIRIDDYDTWSADTTIALVALPLLKRLKELTNGSPLIDSEDLPDHLKLSKRERKIFNEGHYNKRLKVTEEEKEAINKKHHDGWYWVLDEIIYAFECQVDWDWDSQFHSGNIDILWADVEGTEYKEMKRGPNDTHVFDVEGHKKAWDRRNNAMRLFGKYYNALWW